jgi:hypothetical protein
MAQRRGPSSGEIDLAGISTKIDAARHGVTRSDSTTLISGGIDSSLFTYDKSVVRQLDEDLDANLRSRGHPGLRMSQKSTSRGSVSAIRAPGALSFCLRPFPDPYPSCGEASSFASTMPRTPI